VKFYFKIFFNLIKNHLSRFLTIIAIITLSIAFLTGMLSTSQNMYNSLDNYYFSTNMHDLNLKSYSVFLEDDIALFNKIDGKVMLSYEENIEVENDNFTYIRYNNDSLDQLTLLSGRLPSNENEVLVSNNVTKENFSSLGVKVVGKVKTPLEYQTSSEKHYIFHYIESIAYNNAYIKFPALNSYSRFNDKYFTELTKLSTPFLNNYIVLTLKQNSSFMSYKSYVSIIQKIANVIPFFFLMIASLVILSSITRTIDYDRNKIGVLRFLGYSKTYIYSLYIGFSLLCLLIGSFIGVVSGFRLIPQLIYSAFSSSFVLPELSFGFYYSTTFYCVLGLLGIIFLISFFETRKKLKENVTQLLKLRSPKNATKIILEKITFIWKKLSFKYKATFRNLFLYRGRLIMTILGIMGCSALIFTGLGLSDSIEAITNNQYKTIMLYQYKITTNHIIDNIEAYYYTEKSIPIENVTNSGNVQLTLIQDNNDINQYINLKTTNGKKIEFKNQVLITENIARAYKLKANSLIVLEGKEYIVSAVIKSYIEPLIIISANDYHIHSDINKAFLKNIDLNVLENIPDIVINHNTIDLEKEFVKLKNQVSLIVMIVIFSAICLAVLVTYNLTSINIEERTIEIGTLKILGYNKKEILGYVFREIFIIAAFSAVLGYLLGFIFERYIISSIDSFNLILSRNISAGTLIGSFVITIVVSIIVDLFMLIKLQKIKMTSSLVE
jgi:putative ABC transport system permease protein